MNDLVKLGIKIGHYMDKVYSEDDERAISVDKNVGKGNIYD